LKGESLGMGKKTAARRRFLLKKGRAGCAREGKKTRAPNDYRNQAKEKEKPGTLSRLWRQPKLSAVS